MKIPAKSSRKFATKRLDMTYGEYYELYKRELVRPMDESQLGFCRWLIKRLNGILTPPAQEFANWLDLHPEIINMEAEEIAEMAFRAGGGRWIPVGERLPVMGERVLLCWENSEGDFMAFGFYDPDQAAHWWFNANKALDRCDKVTHWMPHPKYPEQVACG